MYKKITNKIRNIVYSQSMDATKLISHRGDNTNYPENSYQGIESALKTGALYVEFDVQMNADNSLVVIHDTDFKRTANNSAYLFQIGDKTTQSISIHGSHKFQEKYNPTFTPYLSDILKLFTQYPKAQALIEIKRESLWYWGLDYFMEAFIKLVKEYSSQSIVISFGLDALEYTKKHSNLKTGLVFYDYQTCNYEIAKKLKPEYMICPYTVIPQEKLWEGDWKWVVYSINDYAKATTILNRADIDMIETDDICLLLESDK